jgi:predicted nucleic acid-binding protein
MMFTIDASVHINALNPNEIGSSDSQAFLEQAYQLQKSIFSPTLLLVEIAAAVSRVFDDADRGIALAEAIRFLPRQTWLPLDEALAQEAGMLAAKYRLRGADAVYAAVAQRSNAILITLDEQQLQRLSPVMDVRKPVDALS